MSPQRSRSTSSGSRTRSTPARADDSAEDQDRVEDTSAHDDGGSGNGGGRSRRRPLRDLLAEARDQLEDLLGRPAQAVTSVEREEDGWLVQVEVIELERIPASTSILGLYEVHLDSDGNVLEYNRAGRYYRNQADEGDS